VTGQRPTPIGVPKMWLSVQEAAWALGVSAPVVRRLIRAGDLPTVPHLGDRLVRIPTKAVEAFANGQAAS
jgi:excisionase family DNA binding protein